MNRCYKRIVTAVKGKALKSRFDFEDLLSETHIKLAKAIGTNSFTDNGEHDEEKFMGWIYVIVRNIAINESRSKYRQTIDKGENALDNSEYLPRNRTNQPDIDIKDFDKELKEYLQEVFKDKPKHVKLCFEGYFYNQTKYEELARIVSIPLGTVKTDIHSVRRLIKKKFGNRYALLMNQS